MFNKMMLEREFTDGITALCEVITVDTQARLVADNLACPANMQNAIAQYKTGRKFAKVLVGSSVRYFVRISDGYIFASASRNAPNFNRSFGNLWTIGDFDWGNYEARAKPGTPWTMVPVAGGSGYMTAVPV